MIEYRFCDTDELGMAEYDISGNEYKALLDICFEYCSILTVFVRHMDVSLPAQLDADRIPVTPELHSHYKCYCHTGEVRAYRLTAQNRDFIFSIADSMFSWIYGWGHRNPEDPVFYRSDGSMFLSSVVHEGHVSIYPRTNEDVSSIIHHPNWIKITNNK